MLKSMINPDLSGKKLILVLGFMLIMLLALSANLMAANQVVTSNADDGSGELTTLREAIAAVGDGETITFNLSSGNETITISSELSISGKSMTINGDNSAGSGTDITVQVTTPGSGGSSFRVFNINASGKTITLENMTIKGGDISGETSDDASGGGIFVDSGTLNLDNLTINGSKATWGGGLFFRSNTTGTIQASTISNNTAANYGGGIHLYLNTISISQSTICNNTAAGYSGGGIYCNRTTLTINNSTIYGNSCNDGGGGIYITYVGTSVDLVNVTLAENTAGDYGGGVYFNEGTLTAKNTIIANNSGISGSQDYYYRSDLATAFNDNGYNVVENQRVDDTDFQFTHSTDILYNSKADGTSSTSWNRNSVELPNQNLNLSSTLADNNTINGTQTLKTTSGSFVIDAGTSSGAPTTDQRGANRNGATDIGAYEYWDDDASLPVELSSFTAENWSGGVLLKWTTESEIENLGFILERRDSKLEIGNWEEIAGYLSNTALEGHGSTTEAHEYQYMDRAVQPGATYEYRLGDVDYSGKVTWHDKIEIKVKAEDGKIPTEFGLQRAYPNPFNPTTTISYQLASASFVKISIYDVRGKLIETLVNEQKDRGNYSVVWDAGGLSSGIYLYKIAAGEYSDVNKCLLIR